MMGESHEQNVGFFLEGVFVLYFAKKKNLALKNYDKFLV